MEESIISIIFDKIQKKILIPKNVEVKLYKKNLYWNPGVQKRTLDEQDDVRITFENLKIVKQCDEFWNTGLKIWSE